MKKLISIGECMLELSSVKDDKMFWGQVSDILNNMMCKPMKSIVEQEMI